MRSGANGNLGRLVVPIQKHVELEMFYKHQNNTGTSPNQQVKRYRTYAQPVL
jgi:hypothetical protein